MQAQLQRIEIKLILLHDDDLSIENAARRQRGTERIQQLRKVAVQRLFVVIFGLVPMHARPVQQKTTATPIVITHVTVINPGTSSVLPNRTVVIIGDRIASLSDAATFQTPKNARVIDATGKFLIPGLW